jgi:trans-2-enoyl-CoA reductase
MHCSSSGIGVQSQAAAQLNLQHVLHVGANFSRTPAEFQTGTCNLLLHHCSAAAAQQPGWSTAALRHDAFMMPAITWSL